MMTKGLPVAAFQRHRDGIGLVNCSGCARVFRVQPLALTNSIHLVSYVAAIEGDSTAERNGKDYNISVFIPCIFFREKTRFF